MKRSIITLSIVCGLFFAGCGGGGSGFSRYPSVCIPGYDAADYARDLAGRNPELKYNAVCNLGSQATQFAETLSAEEADPESEGYALALEVYDGVRAAAMEKDDQLTAASLRFLQVFARKYKAKEELADLVVTIKSDHPQVVYEQVQLIATVGGSHPEITTEWVDALLNHDAWIVSRSALQAIGRRGSVPLLTRLDHAANDRERLILIGAMRNGLTTDEARRLEVLAFETLDQKIRAEALQALRQNYEVEGVRAGFIAHYPKLSETERARVFKGDRDDELAIAYIGLGSVPCDDYMERVAECMMDSSMDGSRSFPPIEQALLQQSAAAGRYRELKAEYEREIRLYELLDEDMNALVKRFQEETNALLLKAGLTEKERDEVLAELCQGFPTEEDDIP